MTDFAFLHDPRPGYWLGRLDALAETGAPAVEIEADPRIEADALRLAAHHGYRRVAEYIEDGVKMWAFNLREAPQVL